MYVDNDNNKNNDNDKDNNNKNMIITVTKIRMIVFTSAPMSAWKLNFPPLGNYDRPTDRPTRRTERGS